ncbi:hypothetical protein K9M41_03845 [Candidatus Gracilibacteria bacterium]|nr:hypothetical protein [Candidatus Gracilibacteria bacterium]
MKQKLLFGIGLLLFAPFLVFAENIAIPGGLDWDNSMMQIVFTEPGEAVATTPAFSCLGVSLPFNESLSAIGFSDETHELNLNNCFQQAGDYVVTITLVDLAGNPSNSTHHFRILPTTPSEETSTLESAGNCNTVGDNPNANGADECGMTFTVRDAFGNPVYQVNSVKLWSSVEDFEDDANTRVKFREGLKILEDQEGIPTAEPDEENLEVIGGLKSFGITAVAPSIARYGYLAQRVARLLPFSIKVPVINEVGQVDGGNTTTLNLADIPLAFKHLFSFNITGDEFRWQGGNGADGTIEITPSEGYAGIPAANLRSGVLTNRNPSFVEYYQPENPAGCSAICTEDEEECVQCTRIINDNFTLEDLSELEGIDVEVIAVPSTWEQGVIIDENSHLSFTTDITYEVGGQTVSYPGGGVALNAELNEELDPDGVENLIGYGDSDLGLTIVGADIEGGILGDKTKMVQQAVNDDDYTFTVGNISVKDLREEIRKNATSLIRGSSNTQAGELESSEWFLDSNVAVVENSDVTMPDEVQLPSGKNTLIIKNGNLIIDGNLFYEDNENDSFGVILINDDTDPYLTTGNIFVRPGVTNIVGTYFADGGIMTTADGLEDANGDENDNQLLLTGNIFTRNTLGGSMLRDENGYFTPWGTTEDSAEARRYDLHFVRRYAPGPDGSCTTEGGNGLGDGGCDSNTNAFVIRIDRKASEIPPPGFQSTGSFGR